MTRRPRPERKRDLQGLLGSDALDLSKPATAEQYLSVAELKPGMGQPRREFDQSKLEALAQSIREKGVLQPLVVRVGVAGHEIVAGERRWRAAQLAGLQEVPVVVRDLTEREARQVALIENLQREDLNTVDEVDAKLELVGETLSLSRNEARTRLMQLLREPVGEEHARLEAIFAPLGEQWSSFARNKLKILNWPAPVLEAVRNGLAYTLAQLIVQAPEQHHKALIKMAKKGVSRAELQAEIRKLSTEQAQPTNALRVGRLLSSARWMKGLSASDQAAVEAWLSKMPAVLREKREQ